MTQDVGITAKEEVYFTLIFFPVKMLHENHRILTKA